VSLVIVEIRAAKASKRGQKVRWIFYQKTPTHYQWTTRAFLRLELQRIKSGISWFESKTKIIREAVTTYLNDPLYTLN